MRHAWLGLTIGLGLLAGCGSDDAPEAAGAPPAGSKAEAGCVAGGLDQFDKGGGDPFWQEEGRADFRDFIVAVCRKADAKDLLNGEPPGTELRDIAGQVMLRMVDRGQIRDPR
jgi:hypothetical protein